MTGDGLEDGDPEDSVPRSLDPGFRRKVLLPGADQGRRFRWCGEFGEVVVSARSGSGELVL